MMSIGRASRRENLIWVTGVEPMNLIRTRTANHIRASSRENGCTKQARHMTASDRNRRHAKSALDAGAPSTHDAGAPSTHDPKGNEAAEREAPARPLTIIASRGTTEAACLAAAVCSAPARLRFVRSLVDFRKVRGHEGGRD
jgi:hypothetical protein